MLPIRINTVLVITLAVLLNGCNLHKEDLSQSLSEQLKTNAEEHGIPAQALMIKHNQKLLYSQVYGVSDIQTDKPVSKQNVFPVYSVSKLFASTLVMQLIESGELNLSDPISQFVPNLPSAWIDIRIEQLLNHTSGIPEYFECTSYECKFPPSIDLAYEHLKGAPLLFEPDTQISYSQTNYLLIQSALENITKKPYRYLVNYRIFKPLKLESTWLGLKDVPKSRLVTAYHSKSGDTLKENKVSFPEYAVSHADAYSSLSDLATFFSAMANGRLVSKQLLLDFWQPYQLSNGDTGYFATGWDFEKTGLWQELGHDGGGLVRVRLLFQENLDNHFIIVYLTNGNKDGEWSSSLVDSVQYYIMPDLISRMATLI